MYSNSIGFELNQMGFTKLMRSQRVHHQRFEKRAKNRKIQLTKSGWFCSNYFAHNDIAVIAKCVHEILVTRSLQPIISDFTIQWRVTSAKLSILFVCLKRKISQFDEPFSEITSG